MTHPINVYLDSSDFSHLSEPRTSAEAEARDRLIEMASNPKIRFLFSGAHISEMAPLKAEHADRADTRIAMLVELCKHNCLIGIDRLIGAEGARLVNSSEQHVAAIRSDGTWFPDLGQILTPAKAIANVKLAMKEEADKLGLNRVQRRLLKSKTLRNGKFRPALVAQDRKEILDEILAIYPMRPKDAEVLLRFYSGEASAAEADQAFLESLRDPRWMMKWFHDHHDHLGPVGMWVRNPAKNIAQTMAAAANKAHDVLALEREIGKTLISDKLTSSAWKRAQDDFVIRIVTDVIKRQTGQAISPIADVSIVDKFCPGVATCIRVMHSSLRKSIGKFARALEPNDFVDAAHAMYAPYVHFFRADAYMSPIVEEHATKYGTRVIRRIVDLPTALESALQANDFPPVAT